MAGGLQRTLRRDADSWAYRVVYRPMLVLQLGLYLYGLSWFVRDVRFDHVGGAGDPVLHENHIGNLSHMAEQPDAILLGIHLGMAIFWIAGVLVQKFLVGGMADALSADHEAFRRTRRVHAVVGTAMCTVALAGCVAGPVMAWQSHGHPPMRWFLLALPLFFVPAIVMVWRTARAHRHADHRLWANLGFLGPAVASLWAEGLIYALGRHSALGSRSGELAAVGVAYLLTIVLIVVPAFRERRQTRRQPAAT